MKNGGSNGPPFFDKGENDMNKKSAERRFVFACLAPATILLLLFMFVPTVNTFRMSLYQTSVLSGNEVFVGFNNYKDLLKDKLFLQAMQNSIMIIVLITICTVVLAVLFATLLQRGNFKGKNFFRVIFYIPNILSIVVIAGIFGAIYNPDTGLLNTFLQAIGLGRFAHRWTSEPDIVIYSVIFALVWQAIGYYMVMYMSSMSTIPEDYYEAASLDGATEIQMFFQITFPLIWSNIRTTLTFYVISTINLSFLYVQLMGDGAPGGKTQVFLNYMYKQAHGNGAYGYGMAIGVVVFIFSFALSAILNKATEREVYEF